MFEEKPIWSRAALQWRVKVTQMRIRKYDNVHSDIIEVTLELFISCSVLPLIAYNFVSGPYKRLWIKFGYDPRTDPASKLYQCLDFRVPKDINIIESQFHVSGTHTVHKIQTCPTIFISANDTS